MELPVTGQVGEWYVSRSHLTRSNVQEDVSRSCSALDSFRQFMDEMEMLLSERRAVHFQQGVWYDTKTGLLLPDFDKNFCRVFTFEEFGEAVRGKKQDECLLPFAGFQGRSITSEECRALFSGRTDHYPHEPGRRQPRFIIDGKEVSGRYIYTQLSWHEKELEGYGAARSLFLVASQKSFLCALENGDFLEKSGSSFTVRGSNKQRSAVFIPVVQMTGEGASSSKEKIQNAARQILSAKLVPDGMEAENVLRLSEAYLKMKEYLSFHNGEWQLDIEAWHEAAERDERLQLSMEMPAIIKMLSECDTRRADLTPYPEKYLTDRNLGHWELYESKLLHDKYPEDYVEIPFMEPLLARDPRTAVKDGGVCAIDFGTRSTVVVCMEGTDKRLIRAGRGDFINNPSPSDYENPTVIELRDYDKFVRDYNDRAGRPFTEWSDIRVSHAALNELNESEDENISASVFSDLKQWSNRRHGVIELRDQKGREIWLRPYPEIDKVDFDPICFYAYYLGLYINNMYNGVYLDYVMSFPVRYEPDVKQYILESFSKGLSKSLPNAVLNDSSLMKKFRVEEGASEPAAYAACALRELASNGKIPWPEEGNPVQFAVFDFGGGTTDFDFGLWRTPTADEGGYNYTIEHFAAESDLGLGGEKLLNMIAYEVYKENLEEMRANSIPIILPDGCRVFDGGELLIGDSLPARMNLRRLSDLLRPLWHEEESFETFGDERHRVALFNDRNENKNIAISVPANRLKGILERRIGNGVQNFLYAQRQAISKWTGADCHILLAGNGCKSSILRRIFKESLQKEKTNLSPDILFHLHFPVSEGENADNYERVPTGKTGVAFGLIACRSGGSDILAVDKNEAEVFRFILGDDDGQGHFHAIIPFGAKHNRWYPFKEMTADCFEILYSEEPRAVGGNVLIEETGRKSCSVNYKHGQKGGWAYIRITGIRSIQYAAMTEDGKNFLSGISSREF